MASFGGIYDVSIDLLDSTDGDAIIREVCERAASEVGVTEGFRYAHFVCPRDPSCPKWGTEGGERPHGHAFWKGNAV